jgi:DNA topoisomerase-3
MEMLAGKTTGKDKSEGIAAYAPFARQVLKEGWVKPSKRIFDDTKITDHFAIIPTLQAPRNLSDAEAKLYDMVVKRFLRCSSPRPSSSSPRASPVSRASRSRARAG